MEPKFTYLVYDETMRSVNLAVAHMQEVLNQKASEGWELHSFTMDTGGGRCLYIFKKPVS
jgi:hypothetical protein